MKEIILENERGILIKNGRYAGLLEPGKYRFFGDVTVQKLPAAGQILPSQCTLETLLSDPKAAVFAEPVTVEDGHLALHFVDGVFRDVLRPGRYAFWKISESHSFTIVDTTEPEITGIPAGVLVRMPSDLYLRVNVFEYQKARLYYDNRLVRILDGGVYYFWRGGVDVAADIVDTRVTRMTVTGQELLTADKVALRVTFVCNYRITDCVKVLTEIDDFREQIHVTAQLALRDYIGRRSLDDILENKEELSAYVGGKLSEKAPSLYVEISDAGVRDIILPGEIRSIMNTVLVAEKKAQANVITRREEVASTRSLLNTAKLMDENKTLYRLKEMEYIEKLCEKVGNINLSGQGDILSQLASVMGSQKKQDDWI
ncbi:MAG: slipin family protein [Clostridia bacterium]|nr:slipin family protein [Clostridia bacterium]